MVDSSTSRREGSVCRYKDYQISGKVEMLIHHTCVSMQPVAGAGPSLAGPCKSGVASFFTLDTSSMKKKLKYATYHKVKPVSFTQIIIA